MATYNSDGTTDYEPGESNDRASTDGVKAATTDGGNAHAAASHVAPAKHVDAPKGAHHKA